METTPGLVAGLRRLPWIASVPRRDVVALAGVVLMYLALVVFQTVRVHPKVFYDEYVFMDVGRQIVLTGLPTRTFHIEPPELFLDHTPLYVYFVAVVTWIGGPVLEVLRSVTLALGIGTVVLVYWIARQTRGFGSAVVGSAFLALNPFFAEYSWFVYMEVPLCFFLVAAVLALSQKRALTAGVLIAVAVLLKEIALAFLLVAVGFELARRRLRGALLVAAPTVMALGAWFAYAMSLNRDRFVEVMSRWIGSAAGGYPDPRTKRGPLLWAHMIADTVLGPVSVFLVGAATPLAALWRRDIPAIAALPIAYIALAVAASFVIRLKEPRHLIAIVPMLALTIGLTVDWGRVWAQLRSGGIR